MKFPRMALALVLSAITCHAQEAKFTGAPWDSWAIPMGVAPYYLSVDSEAKAKSAALELDVYVKGKFAQTISPPGIAMEEGGAALKMNCAIYFNPKEDGTVDGTMVSEWGRARSSNKFSLPAEQFSLKKGTAAAGGTVGKIPVPGRSAVFVIATGPGSFSFPTKLEDTPAANPNASVIIGYLKTE